MRHATVFRLNGDIIYCRDNRGAKPRVLACLLDKDAVAFGFFVGCPIGYRLLGYDGQVVGGYFRRGVHIRANGRFYRALKVS